MKHTLPLTAAGLAALSGNALAADVQLKLSLPRLPVAEYHKPYVAVWLERPGEAQAVAQLATWYDLGKPNNAGSKWMRDLRQWWRAGGRSLGLPADGVSGATRAPGEHVLNLGQHAALRQLPPGDYELVVEVAREAGGREVRRLPLHWPVKAASQQRQQGEDELGAVELSVKP